MNTQAFSAFGQGTVGTLGGGLGLGLSFQDFPASQDNYLEFAEFSQVCSRHLASIMAAKRPGRSGCCSVVAVAAPLFMGALAAFVSFMQGADYSGIDDLSLGVQQVKQWGCSHP